ncbi:MAG TPA: Uma2 family endonuclease [Thermomicrobiales bacterium]|nr:Uma2 family endonuclease [Thermomicrobiales bacterium]
MVTTKLATADDLAALPDDGFWNYELIRGEIRKMAPAGEGHGRIASRMMRPLFALEDSLGGEVLSADTGYFIEYEPDTVLAPDAAFVQRDQLRPVGEVAGFSRSVPLLVIEVKSPSESMREVLEKVDIYRRAGVPLIWVALPATQTVLVDGVGRERQTLGISDTLDGGDILPGLRVPISDIFR